MSNLEIHLIIEFPLDIDYIYLSEVKKENMHLL